MLSKRLSRPGRRAAITKPKGPPSPGPAPAAQGELSWSFLKDTQGLAGQGISLPWKAGSPQLPGFAGPWQTPRSGISRVLCLADVVITARGND